MKKEVEDNKKRLEGDDMSKKEIIEKLVRPEVKEVIDRPLKPNEELRPEVNPVKKHLKMCDIEEFELMIQLCTNKKDLIKVLNEMNRVLLENKDINYKVKVNKR